MMDNESLRGSKNTTVIFLILLLVAAFGWAVWASVTLAKRTKECDTLTAENEQIKVDAAQKTMQAEQKMAEAEKLRKVALEMTRQHQLQLQEDLRKKAAEAAKAAVTAKTPAAGHSATNKPTLKQGTKKITKPGTPSKKHMPPKPPAQ